MSSTPPSSPSSFHSSTCSSSWQSSHAPKSTQYYQYEPTFSGTFLNDETEEELDDDSAITTTTTTTITTTVVKSPSHVTTPRFQTPPPTLMMLEMNRRSASMLTLSYPPLLPTKLSQGPAPSAQFDHPLPTKPPVSSTKGQGKAKQLSTSKLSYCIPHPDELPCPGHIFSVPKKWHVVTVGQEALEEYRWQYDARKIEIVLLPGSKWANAASLEDEYSQLDYNEEVEQALCEAKAHAVAEQAYKSAMEACGYKV
ncbi:hypothetical protein ARMGADRAFT_1039286 [Armillaria gallica]|uniref:Uncharacterized protein n=1 Tax=Armillaria gallica TaxID=47427 RepID=A0A2H3CEG8_ARMGA|nr:hypothetical protein ARMGADRAFT_1039286 [Armillaria gallica]